MAKKNDSPRVPMSMALAKISLAILVLAFSFVSFANEKEEANANRDVSTAGAFALYVENDTRGMGGPGSDQAYSNGLKISYVYAQDRIPDWSEKPVNSLRLLEHDLSGKNLNFALSLGQQLYTPMNIHETSLILDDRPYAGWLYLGFAVSLKEENIEQTIEWDVGTIGPSALGQQVQNNFHDLIRRPRAEGWSNSLHDEPTLQLFYQKRFKSFYSKNLDFIPYYGAGVGNVLVGAHIGGLIRFGVNLPDNFGPSRPSASEGESFISHQSQNQSLQRSYFVFSGARGRATARNIFLDGNTFQSSHHVKKYPFTFETEFGLGLQVPPFSLVWSFVTRSPEFEQRSIFNSFASMNLIYSL